MEVCAATPQVRRPPPAWPRRRSAPGRSRREPVAKAPHGAEAPRIRGIVLDLLSQAADVDCDGGGTGVERRFVPPDLRQQLLPRKRNTGMPGQAPQQIELGSGEADVPALQQDLAAVSVDRQTTGLDVSDRPLLRRRNTPQDRLDPDHQLPRRKRLDDVVVGTQFEPSDAVGLLAPCREQDNWEVPFGPDPP